MHERVQLAAQPIEFVVEIGRAEAVPIPENLMIEPEDHFSHPNVADGSEDAKSLATKIGSEST